MLIEYIVKESLLDLMIVAKNDKGLCALFLGSNPADLVLDLQARFPTATIRENEKAFVQIIPKIKQFLLAADNQFDYPLDMIGTVFQQKVWDALTHIPFGIKKTYKQIAILIGMPKATRAVANACGANPISILVPCHRVVRSDGSLSGYRWGIERKKKLLEAEALAIQQQNSD